MLVGSSCCNKTPQTRRIKQQKFTYISEGLGIQGLGLTGGFLVRTLLPAGTVFSRTTLTPPLTRTRLSDQLHPHELIILKHLLTPSSPTLGARDSYTDFEGTRFNPQHEGCPPKAWTVRTHQKKKARKRLGGSEADIAATFSIKLNTCASKPSSSQLSRGDALARTQ